MSHFRRGGEVAVGSDGELLGRFAAHGDQQAFAEIVRRHGGMVLRICRRTCGNGDDHAAADAAQEVFLSLAGRANALQTRRSLAGWLYRTAWHVSSRMRRAGSIRAGHEQRAGMARMLASGTDGVRESAPFALITSELSDALGRALATLPENYRDALVVHHFAGHTVEETARALGVKAGTAASWLSRGRAMLRERLDGLAPAALSSDVVARWLIWDNAEHGDESEILGEADHPARVGMLERGVVESLSAGAGGGAGAFVASPAGRAAAAGSAGALVSGWRAAAAAVIVGCVGSPLAAAGTAVAAVGTVAAVAHTVNNANGQNASAASDPAKQADDPVSKPRWASAGAAPAGSIPEPSGTLVVIAAGVSGLLVRRRRRRASRWHGSA